MHSRYTTGNQPYNLPYNEYATSQIWALPSCPRSSHAAAQPVAPSRAPSFLFTHLWICHHGYGGEGWRLTEEHTSKKEVRDRDGEREEKRTRAEKLSHSGRGNLLKNWGEKNRLKRGRWWVRNDVTSTPERPQSDLIVSLAMTASEAQGNKS